jgi:tRNA (cmo5U34)-methyltransferase
MSRDTIYRLPRQRVGEFEFDQAVADVFPDMISRSVPGYASVLSMIEQLTGRFAQPGTNLYDLGCSLGAATRLLQAQAPTDCLIHAVDSSSAMLQRLGSTIDAQGGGVGAPVQLHLSDVRHVQFSRASFVVLNWTLQFVPLNDRGRLLQSIFDGMVSGGALLLSEKICFDDAHQQQLLSELHHDFKSAHGYSDLEISQKRNSLENRLIPETLSEHCRRLSESGFQRIIPWFQCFNFASILAVKTG